MGIFSHPDPPPQVASQSERELLPGSWVESFGFEEFDGRRGNSYGRWQYRPRHNPTANGISYDNPPTLVQLQELWCREIAGLKEFLDRERRYIKRLTREKHELCSERDRLIDNRKSST